MATTLFRQKGFQFFTSINGIVTPLAGGLLYYYQSGTTNPQATYSEQTGTTSNSFPITLDAYGRLPVAVYLGSNNDYKETLTDSTGVTVSPWPFDGIPKAQTTTIPPLTGFERLYMGWTAVTSTSSPLTLLTANAGAAYEIDATSGSVIINLPAASAIQAGTGYTFKRTDTAANTVTIVPSGSDQIDGINAAVSLPSKAAITVSSDSAAWQIAWGLPSILVKPGGRLTLTTGVPVISSDVASATTVYYTACESGQVPVWNGANYIYYSFAADLALTLTASILASNSIVDVFAFNNSGALAIGAGPAWTGITPGSCARGTGAGTTQLSRAGNGLLTNTVAITLKNGATTYSSLGIGQCTYLGSLYGDAVAGQVSCYVSFGQNRKWGVWNAYCRRSIMMQAGDSTANWLYSTTSWRASNNNSANTITTFTGLAEESISANFAQSIQSQAGSIITAYTGIGLNSTTSPTGKTGAVTLQQSAANSGADAVATTIIAPTLGLTQVNCIEEGGGSNATFYGSSRMLLSTLYNG